MYKKKKERKWRKKKSATLPALVLLEKERKGGELKGTLYVRLILYGTFRGRRSDVVERG